MNEGRKEGGKETRAVKTADDGDEGHAKGSEEARARAATAGDPTRHM